MNWLVITNRKAIFSIGVLLLTPFFVFGQSLNVPLNQTFSVEVERAMLATEEIIPSSFKPILARESRVQNSVNSLKVESSMRSWISKRLFHEHFITVDSGNFTLTLDPLVNFEIGVDDEFDARSENNLYKNTRGFLARLQFGEKVSIESTFRENQAVLPFFLHERVRLSGVAYGQGRTKTFKDNGFDFATASAYISVSPNNRINIQAGTGKHFVGNGHRSLFLSDVAFNSPFLRLNTSWFDGKLQYQNLYTLHQDLNRVISTATISEGLFERKQMATHYLEYSPNHRFSIGLFESTIFPSLDTSGNLPVGFNYWVPVIFLNSLLEGEASKGNNKIGLNANYRVSNSILLYGQLALQSEHINSQFGVKVFPHKTLMLQAEFNQVAAQDGANLFTHYNESLAHPIAYDATEIIGIAQFQKNRWLTRAAANFILNDNVEVTVFDFRQSFIVNPAYNFTFQVGCQIRRFESFTDEPSFQVGGANAPFVFNSNFIYIGLSTNLQNIYTNY